MTSMAGASKLNTSHQHHCHGQNPWFNQQPLPWAIAGVALFSLSFSLYLYFSLSFYFSAVVLWFMAKSFSFYCLLVCGFGDLVSFWGLMIWKKKGFWFGFGGVRKKGFLFRVLGVQKVEFLACVWLCFCVGILGHRVFYGWMCVCCVLCNACEVWKWVKSSHEHSTHSGGGYWLNHGVLTMAVVLVACVELWSSGHGSRGFDFEMKISGEERRVREGERLKA